MRCLPLRYYLKRVLRDMGAPEGPARHLDVSRQKLTRQCLATIFDSQLPSPKLSPKMPPNLSLAHKRGHLLLFQNDPCGEGNCETIERQKLSRDNFCPATSRCLFWPTGGVSRTGPLSKPVEKLHKISGEPAWFATLSALCRVKRASPIPRGSKIGRHLVGVWIGGVWNDHFPESEKYYSEAEISRKMP